MYLHVETWLLPTSYSTTDRQIFPNLEKAQNLKKILLLSILEKRMILYLYRQAFQKLPYVLHILNLKSNFVFLLKLTAWHDSTCL